jgi:hypothetical protein
MPRAIQGVTIITTMSNQNLSNPNSTAPFSPQLDKLRTMSIGAVVIGAVLAAFGALGGAVKSGNVASEFWQAYLMAYLFWVGVTVAPVALLLLHNTVGGGWGFLLRAQLTAASKLVPLAALFSLIWAIGVGKLYPWAQSEEIAAHAVVAKQQWWMQPNYVFARMAIYFTIWYFFSHRVNALTWNMTPVNASKNVEKLNKIGPWGLIAHVTVVTFWAVDVIMTLTPGMLSTIIGPLYLVGQGLSTWTLMAILTAYVANGKAPLSKVPSKYIRDIGNFTLGFTMLWAYMSYSQFVITFSGNQAEEALWYEQRQRGGWQMVGILLVGAHFVLPFLSLLSSNVKTKIGNLAKLGIIIIFMRFVDLFYWVQPKFNKTVGDAMGGLVFDIAVPLIMGGLWIYAWATLVRNQPLVPEHDSRLNGEWPLNAGHDERHKSPHSQSGYESASGGQSELGVTAHV